MINTFRNGVLTTLGKRIQGIAVDMLQVQQDRFDPEYQAKAILAVAQAEAEGVRKEAEAPGEMGGHAYVRMQLAKQVANKKILIVPGSNVSTMNVNELVGYLIGNTQQQAAQQQPQRLPLMSPSPWRSAWNSKERSTASALAP